MQKTANATEIKKYLNLFFNPFEYKDLPRTPTETDTQSALKHAGGLALGYGSLGLLARYIKKSKDEADRTPNSEKMKAYLAAKNPILSMDKSRRDLKREEKIKRIGAEDVTTESELLKRASEIIKEAEEGVSGSPYGTGKNDPMGDLWSGGTSALKKISDKDVHPSHMAAAVVAARPTAATAAGLLGPAAGPRSCSPLAPSPTPAASGSSPVRSGRRARAGSRCRPAP